MKLRFSPAAAREVAAAFSWYERAHVGLGSRFNAALREVFSLLQAYPEAGPPVFRSFRQAQVRSFPFVVIYEPKEEAIEVLAVFHTARDPKTWLDRAR